MNEKIKLSNIIPLDIAFSLLHSIKNKFTDNPELEQLENYIFIKEIKKEQYIKDLDIVDFCVVAFRENDQLLKNTNLYNAYCFIRDYIVNLYGYEEDSEKFNYDYENLISTPSLFPSLNYDYKNLYIEKNESNLFRNLDFKWSLLNSEHKLKWILFGFISLDWGLLKFLDKKEDLYSFLSKNLNQEEINAIFEMMLFNYTFLSYFEEHTAYNSLYPMEALYAYSFINNLHKYLIDSLNDENLKTYLDLMAIIKEFFNNKN